MKIYLLFSIWILSFSLVSKADMTLSPLQGAQLITASVGAEKDHLFYGPWNQVWEGKTKEGDICRVFVAGTSDLAKVDIRVGPSISSFEVASGGVNGSGLNSSSGRHFSEVTLRYTENGGLMAEVTAFPDSCSKEMILKIVKNKNRSIKAFEVTNHAKFLGLRIPSLPLLCDEVHRVEISAYID